MSQFNRKGGPQDATRDATSICILQRCWNCTPRSRCIQFREFERSQVQRCPPSSFAIVSWRRGCTFAKPWRRESAPKWRSADCERFYSRKKQSPPTSHCCCKSRRWAGMPTGWSWRASQKIFTTSYQVHVQNGCWSRRCGLPSPISDSHVQWCFNTQITVDDAGKICHWRTQWRLWARSVFCRILAVSPWSRYGTPDSTRTANSTEYCFEALLGGRVIQLEVVYRNVYLERNAKIVFFFILSFISAVTVTSCFTLF